MSVGDAIADFITGTYTVQRPTAGAVVKGKVTPGVPETFTIEASIQPLGGRELMRLPEGQRGQERRLCFTTTLLQTGTRADVVLIGAERWEVEGVEDWMTLGGFYKATIARVND